MFGLFPKKPNPIEQAVSLIYSVLSGQISLAGSKGGTKEILEDEWAMGYIFGYVDSVLQQAQIGGEAASMAVMTAVHEKLFDVEGVNALRRSLGLQGRRDFLAGMMAGGEEAASFMQTGSPTLGLAFYFRNKS